MNGPEYDPVDAIERAQALDYVYDEIHGVLHCTDCGEWIRAGEYYFEIGGEIICENCIKDYQKIA